MATRGYQYSKPRKLLCIRRAEKFSWILAMIGSRMTYGVVALDGHQWNDTWRRR